MKKYLIFVMLLICTGCSVTKNKIPNNIQRDNDEKKLIENEKIESIEHCVGNYISDSFNSRNSTYEIKKKAPQPRCFF